MVWDYIIHISIISCSLLLGSFLRAKIPFLQRFLIPAPMIGGFFMLLFYNYVAPSIGLNSAFLGDLVYHLLNISFISMMLRMPDRSQRKSQKNILWQNTVSLVAEYGLQCLLGLLATALLINTFLPDLFPAIGLTLVLGFELGPGQAFSMTSVWEPMGFTGATSVGLAMAAIGFIVGSVGGVILINQAVKRGWIAEKYLTKLKGRGVRTGFIQSGSKGEVGSYQTTDGGSVDSFTFHLALVMFTYLLSFGLMSLIEFLLSFAGNLGMELATSLWGINFIFSVFCAVIVRKLLMLLNIEHIVDNSTCNRISGLAVDLTVASSLGAISLAALSGYWVPILILTVIGILIACFFTPWFCSRIFSNHQFFRMLMIFGTATGTLPTALSLLRVVDPDFETPVAQDYVYSTGVMFFLAIPIITMANMPAFSVTHNNPALFWIFVGVSAVYVLVALFGFKLIAGKRAFEKPKKFFYIDHSND